MIKHSKEDKMTPFTILGLMICQYSVAIFGLLGYTSGFYSIPELDSANIMLSPRARGLLDTNDTTDTSTTVTDTSTTPGTTPLILYPDDNAIKTFGLVCRM